MTAPAATVEVTVEFEDVDSYGIVHHSRLVCYLERARLRLLEALGLPLCPDGNTFPVMYELRTRFHRPAKLLDRLQVSVELADHDDFQIQLKYRIRRGDDLLVRASSAIAFWDQVRDKPASLPAELAGRFEGTG